MYCPDAVRRAKTGLDTLQGMGFASGLGVTFACKKFAQPARSGWTTEQHQWQPMTRRGFVLSVPLVQGTTCDLTPHSPILLGGLAAFTPSPRGKTQTEAPEQPMATLHTQVLLPAPKEWQWLCCIPRDGALLHFLDRLLIRASCSQLHHLDSTECQSPVHEHRF